MDQARVVVGVCGAVNSQAHTVGPTQSDLDVVCQHCIELVILVPNDLSDLHEIFDDHVFGPDLDPDPTL